MGRFSLCHLFACWLFFHLLTPLRTPFDFPTQSNTQFCLFLLLWFSQQLWNLIFPKVRFFRLPFASISSFFYFFSPEVHCLKYLSIFSQIFSGFFAYCEVHEYQSPQPFIPHLKTASSHFLLHGVFCFFSF